MTTRIPLSAPDITEAEIAAVTAVLRTPHLSLGPELKAFEAELAAFHGVDHAVAVSSGTAGLHLALLTLGVGEGDEVILPSFRLCGRGQRSAPGARHARSSQRSIRSRSISTPPTSSGRSLRAPAPSSSFTPSAFPQRWMRSKILRAGIVWPSLKTPAKPSARDFDGRRAGSFGDLAVVGFLPQQADDHRRRRRGAGARSRARRTPAPAQKSGPRSQCRLARPRRAWLQLPASRAGLRSGPRAVAADG